MLIKVVLDLRNTLDICFFNAVKLTYLSDYSAQIIVGYVYSCNQTV